MNQQFNMGKIWIETHYPEKYQVTYPLMVCHKYLPCAIKYIQNNWIKEGNTYISPKYYKKNFVKPILYPSKNEVRYSLF